jgi:hypothetical protein
MRERLRISESQRSAPRTTENGPTINPKVPAQTLEIRNEVTRRVDLEVIESLNMRPAAPAATLIRQYDFKDLRIEEPPAVRATPRTGPT